MIALSYIAVLSIIENATRLPNATLTMRLAPFLGTILWSFLLWKIWKRPRRWGVRVAILLFLMLAFQIYLWNFATHHPRADLPPLKISTVTFIVFYEIPIFIAGTCCVILLRGTDRGDKTGSVIGVCLVIHPRLCRDQ